AKWPLIISLLIGAAVALTYAGERQEQIYVVQQEAAVRRAEVETQLREQREFERSGKRPSRSSPPSRSTPTIVPNPPVPQQTTAEAFVSYARLPILLVVILVGSLLSIFWLAMRGRDHYDPASVLA